MKPIFRCEYCDKMGTEEAIMKHEQECIYNYTKHSCYTCKHAENKVVSFNCKLGTDVPKGNIFEYCRAYEWDEVDHTTKNPTAANSLFGGLFFN